MDWMYKTVLNKQSPPPPKKQKTKPKKQQPTHTKEEEEEQPHTQNNPPPPPHPTHTEGQTNKHPPTPVYSDTHMKFERLEF